MNDSNNACSNCESCDKTEATCVNNAVVGTTETLTNPMPAAAPVEAAAYEAAWNEGQGEDTAELVPTADGIQEGAAATEEQTVAAASLVKKPEFILALDRRALALFGIPDEGGVAAGNFNSVITDQLLDKYLVIRQREHLDNSVNEGAERKGDTDYLQILPYIIFRSHDGRVFTYSRGKNGGETRLVGDRSAGYGGHVDLSDLRVHVENMSRVHLKATLDMSITRELKEEVVLDRVSEFNLILQPAGVIYDASNEVGQLHLGLVFVVTLPEGVNARPREADTTEHGRLVEVSDLMTDEHENWTKLAAQYLL